MAKKALIVANLIGFVNFLWHDFEILRDMGFELHFAANATIKDFNTDGELQELINKRITFHNIDFDSKTPFSKKNLIAYNQIKKLVKEHQYRLVHCNTPIIGVFTRMAARNLRLNGTTVIYTTHGFSFTYLSAKKEWWFYYTCEKLLSRYTDIIITINHDDFKIAQSMYCKNVKYINGVGVDTEKFKSVTVNRNHHREKIGVGKDDIMILSVGELSTRKNHSIILEALSLLENKEKYTYVICGKGIGNLGTGKYLEELAKERSIKLRLLGHRSDIPEIIKCSDIGAIPSIREGLGLAGIESLSAGVPLVGSDVQGIRDYIINDINGYLCNPFSIEEFAFAIKKLSVKEERQRMKENCFRIAKEFDICVSHKQMREIYESVL